VSKVPEAFSSLTVLDPKGVVVKVASLWAEKPAVIVFLRHFG
jgi:hypothetical protein